MSSEMQIGLQWFYSQNKNVYLMGDYNIDLLNPTRHNTEKFINVLQSNGFYPHINQPTIEFQMRVRP